MSRNHLPRTAISPHRTKCLGNEHRSALFYSPVAHGRLTEKGLNAVIESCRTIAERQKSRSIYSNTSYIYPSDLGGLSPEYWEAMRLETDGVPGLGACGARWVARMLRSFSRMLTWTMQHGAFSGAH